MTVRNGLPFIEDAVKSVFAQEDIEFELIVIDDGSIDETPSFLSQLAKHANARVEMCPRLGRARALNLSVAKARFDFVCNIDADDLLHPRHGAAFISKLLKNDFDVLCSVPQVFSGSTPRWAPVNDVRVFEMVDATLMRRNPVCHSGAIIRKKAFSRVGGYDEDRTTQIDYDLWFRIVASGGHIERTQERLVGKRIHDGQSFENKKRIRYVMNSLGLQRRIIKHFGGGILEYAALCGRGAYAVLPQTVRAWLKG